MDCSDIPSEISKLEPVAGQVLVVKFPPDVDYEHALHVISHINQIAPQGVSVAALDNNMNLMVTNVPELVAMLSKPDVIH